MVDGEWTEKQLLSYALLQGINMAGGQKIIQHSHNIISYDFYKKHSITLNRNLLISDYTKFPEKYQQW